MGTNFYLNGFVWDEDEGYVSDKPCECCGHTISNLLDRDDPELHIGKRSAAGFFCWKCNVTLCKQGESRIHYNDSEWYEACPICGDKKEETTIKFPKHTAVELGFAQAERVRPVSGVSSCASFSWAQDPIVFVEFVQMYGDEEIVKDGYGRKFTGNDFLQMISANCPIQYTDFVGRNFF